MHNIKLLFKRIRWSSPVHQAAVFVAGMSFLFLFLITSVLTIMIVSQNQTESRYDLEDRIKSLSSFEKSTMKSYVRLLNLTAAYLNDNNGQVSAEKWSKYYADGDIANQYQKIVGLGKVTNTSVSTVSGDLKTEITYLEPRTPDNIRATGYDMYSEPKRREAMSHARDNNEIVMTAPVKLVQDIDTPNENIYGVLLYKPLYNQDMPIGTVAERRLANNGFVYVVLRPASIGMEYSQNSPLRKNESLSMFDIRGKDKTLLYSHSNPINPNGVLTQKVVSEAIINGRTWSTEVYRRIDVFKQIIVPLIVLIVGILLSTLTSLALLKFLLSKIGQVEDGANEEIKRSKNELLALASHQLRTPASGVKQYLGILESGLAGDLTEQQQMVVSKAYQANERQLGVINEILYVSKLDAGQLHINKEEFDIASLIQRIVSESQTAAEKKKIQIKAIGVQRKHLINGDERYLGMAIDNLISNAIKYSYPNKKINVRLKKQDKNYIFSVEDKGVGIREEDIDRIFAKFERIDNPLSKLEGGSGLGLYLAKELIDAHDGNIDIKSTEGKGSKFIITLPVKGHNRPKNHENSRS